MTGQKVKNSIVFVFLALAVLLSGCEDSDTDAAVSSQIESTSAADSSFWDEAIEETTGAASSEAESQTTASSIDIPEPEETPEPDEISVSDESPEPVKASHSEIRLEDIPEYTDSPYVVLNSNHPLFDDSEITDVPFEEYYPLDELGRATGAIACISPDLMPTEERGLIGSITPTGWHNVKYDGIEGTFLYNRCHLIGYQLTGENDNENNLITGTRYMNVEGMQPFENRIAWYIQDTGHHVMYRVKPLYKGDDLLAAGVLMESYCIEEPDSAATFCVFCYNVQPGIEIDYATGESSGPEFRGTETRTMPGVDITDGDETAGTEAGSAMSTSSAVQATPIPDEITFVGNRNSGALHYPWCPSVANMKEHNKVFFTETLEDIPLTFHPCGNCMKDIADLREG